MEIDCPPCLGNRGGIVLKQNQTTSEIRRDVRRKRIEDCSLSQLAKPIFELTRRLQHQRVPDPGCRVVRIQFNGLSELPLGRFPAKLIAMDLSERGVSFSHPGVDLECAPGRGFGFGMSLFLWKQPDT